MSVYRKTVIAGMVALALGLAAGGCEKAPTQEINETQAVIDSAQADERIRIWAADQIQAAQAALDSARRFAEEKQYGDARAALARARRTARGASQYADQAVEQSRGQADETISEARSAIEAARVRLATLPRSAARETNELGARLDSAASAVDSAARVQGTSMYREAAALAREALERVKSVGVRVDTLLSGKVGR